MDTVTAFLSGLGAGLMASVLALLTLRLRRWSATEKALIVHRVNESPTARFSDCWVLPIVHRVEEIDLSTRTMVIAHAGKDGIVSQDHVRMDVSATFLLRIHPVEESVLKVAQYVGCRASSDPDTLRQLFAAKFSEALKTASMQQEFADLLAHRMDFRDRVIQIIGEDLGGFILEDVSIDRLEQTPVSQLDPSNILDAQGMLKSAQLTAAAEQARMEVEREHERLSAKHRRDLDALRRR